MRKFITVFTPVAAIILFVCIMLSGSLLKKPLNHNDDIPMKLENIIDDINRGAWDDADAEVENLNKVWKKVIVRIQFSSERDEINYLSVNIARLRGGIQAKDKSGALMEAYEAKEHWKSLGK